MSQNPDYIRVCPTNPNDKIGGGGCLATGGRASEDCAGDWVDFWRVSTEYHASPYATICTKHLAEVTEHLPHIERQAAGDSLPIREQKAKPITDAGLEPIEPTPYVKLAG